MKRADESTPDIYLSCATRERRRAEEVVRRLADAGFRVERVSDLEWQQAVAAEREETVWAALRNSSALVILGTGGHTRSPVLTMEVGGALADRKPIYVLTEPDAADDLPSYLQRQHIVPLSEIEQLAPLLEEALGRPSPDRPRPARSRRS